MKLRGSQDPVKNKEGGNFNGKTKIKFDDDGYEYYDGKFKEGLFHGKGELRLD